MQIVILLLALALLGYILLRQKNARQGRAKKLPHQLTGSDKRAIARMQSVDDPQLAATAMMAAIAKHAGPMNRPQHAAIVEQAMENFEIDQQAAENLVAHAASLVDGVMDLERCFAALVPTIQRACTSEERDDLLDMLAEIASHCPDSSAVEIGSALSSLRNKVS